MLALSSASSSQRRRTAERTNLPTGTVKWWSDEKGFGFITPDDGGRDLFVHFSGVSGDGYRSLVEGAKVSYEEEAGPKGPKAGNVQPLGRVPPSREPDVRVRPTARGRAEPPSPPREAQSAPTHRSLTEPSRIPPTISRSALLALTYAAEMLDDDGDEARIRTAALLGALRASASGGMTPTTGDVLKLVLARQRERRTAEQTIAAAGAAAGLKPVVEGDQLDVMTGEALSRSPAHRLVQYAAEIQRRTDASGVRLRHVLAAGVHPAVPNGVLAELAVTMRELRAEWRASLARTWPDESRKGWNEFLRDSDEPSATSSAAVRVFLCHSSSDKAQVRKLYHRLKEDGLAPWLDEEDLLPGQDWDWAIRRAIRNVDAVAVCLSKSSTTKTGYVQKEIKVALDVADEQPEGTIFVIPVRLEECSVPSRLGHLHRVDLSDDRGYKRLVGALKGSKATDDIIPLMASAARANPTTEHERVLIGDAETAAAELEENIEDLRHRVARAIALRVFWTDLLVWNVYEKHKHALIRFPDVFKPVSDAYRTFRELNEIVPASRLGTPIPDDELEGLEARVGEMVHASAALRDLSAKLSSAASAT